jgi:CRISPR/Cas system-associated protein Cas5 (RAMP superfamily)
MIETQLKELPGVTIEEIRKHRSEGKKELENIALNGKHYPEVEIYVEKDRNKAYQVSEEHGVYRETAGSDDPYEVQEYGDWKNLKDR